MKKALVIALIFSLPLLLGACAFIQDLWGTVNPPPPTPVPVTPLDITRLFINHLNTREPAAALDLVCESMALPNLPRDTFREVNYEQLSADDLIAEVRVSGEIRVEIKLLGAIKKQMDFIVLLDRSADSWCINNDSLSNFFLSMFDFK